MKKIQKVITKDRNDGDYYNFFFTPGSINSMENMIRSGWTLVHINDDKKSERVSAVFEKEVSDGRN